MTIEQYKEREEIYKGYRVAVEDYCVFGEQTCIMTIEKMNHLKGTPFYEGYEEGYEYMKEGAGCNGWKHNEVCTEE